MVTGVEAAGLALAVLPLVIEVGKSYGRGVDSIKSVVITERRDENLQKFYEDFYWETFYLDRTLRKIVHGLPLLCYDCKQSLYSDRDLSVWEEDEEVRRAFVLNFGDEEDLNAFITVLSKVLDLVDRLTRDETTKLTTTDKTFKGVCQRLKVFVDDRIKHNTKSTFLERFRFFKKEKNRNTAVRNLETWNKRLRELWDSQPGKVEQPTIAKPSSLFSEIRKLFDAFVRVVGSNWNCNCPTRHNAMICLKVWPSSVRDGRPKNLEFNILLPRIENQQACRQWLEATVLVESETAVRITDKVVLPKVCDVFGEQVDSALRFLICETDCRDTLWRMRSGPRKYSWLNDCPPTTLYDLLCSNTLIKLKSKRLLAVTFAYAMLQCHASSCITEMLSEKSLYFYRLTTGDTDFAAPFVSTEFRSISSGTSTTNMALQHRSPPILRLGILLLEIHKGVLFDSLLNATEAADASPNRDLEAARRLVEELEEWCSDKYKNAVRACLEIRWIPVGEAVDFANAEVCGGFVEQVIKPLESDLEHLFTTKL